MSSSFRLIHSFICREVHIIILARMSGDAGMVWHLKIITDCTNFHKKWLFIVYHLPHLTFVARHLPYSTPVLMHQLMIIVMMIIMVIIIMIMNTDDDRDGDNGDLVKSSCFWSPRDSLDKEDFLTKINNLNWCQRVIKLLKSCFESDLKMTPSFFTHTIHVNQQNWSNWHNQAIHCDSRKIVGA